MPASDPHKLRCQIERFGFEINYSPNQCEAEMLQPADRQNHRVCRSGNHRRKRVATRRGGPVATGWQRTRASSGLGQAERTGGHRRDLRRNTRSA